MIKARVANKSYLREYSNVNSSGKVFSVGLVDRTGEIEAVGSNHVAEKLYTKFEIGKVSKRIREYIYNTILSRIDLLHIQRYYSVCEPEI
jgi:hypothetical protein